MESTVDHATIRRWAEARGARPARHRQAEHLLRLAFEPLPPHWQELTWDEFFRLFDEHQLIFLYRPEPESRLCKFAWRWKYAPRE